MPRRSTAAEFVVKAQAVHGDRYDYALVRYEGNLTKVTIVCPKHGAFEQVPAEHLRGHGCKACSIDDLFSSTEEFVASARLLHGDRYDYRKVKYKYAKQPVVIICSEHGDFDQRPQAHLSGAGCPKCANEMNGKKNTLPPHDYYALAAQKGISIVGQPPAKRKMQCTWMCSKGHTWRQSYNAVSRSQYSGCPHCAGKAPRTIEDYHTLASENGYRFLGDLPRTTKSTGLWECEQGHQWQGRYKDIVNGHGCPHCAGQAPKALGDYRIVAQMRGFRFVGALPSRVTDDAEWECPFGHRWLAQYHNVRRGSGCPECYKSLGEEAVCKALESLGIAFERQKMFSDCRNVRPLKFDFYFKHKGIEILIEYQGQQHYSALDYFGGEDAYQQRLTNDAIKRQWAKEGGCILIEIPYTVPFDHMVGYIAEYLP